MKRPLAYITAAWSGNHDTDTKQATQYCRKAYEAGFSPVCPLLYLNFRNAVDYMFMGLEKRKPNHF